MSTRSQSHNKDTPVTNVIVQWMLDKVHRALDYYRLNLEAMCIAQPPQICPTGTIPSDIPTKPNIEGVLTTFDSETQQIYLTIKGTSHDEEDSESMDGVLTTSSTALAETKGNVPEIPLYQDSNLIATSSESGNIPKIAASALPTCAEPAPSDDGLTLSILGLLDINPIDQENLFSFGPSDPIISRAERRAIARQEKKAAAVASRAEKNKLKTILERN